MASLSASQRTRVQLEFDSAGGTMSSAQIIQLFRAAAFDPESVATLSAAYDLATRRLHDRDRRAGPGQ